MKPILRDTKAILLLFLASAAAAATLERVATMPRSPVGFYRNTGQLPPEILYVSRTPGANISVTATSVVFGLSAHTLAVKGAKSAPAVSQSNPLPGMVNVYATQDSSKWARGLRLYRWIEFGDILPNVDQRFSFADDGQLSMILTCRPGCDPQAQLQFEYSNLGFTPADLANGSLGIKAPAATQNGQTVDVEYVKKEGTTFGFRIGRFDSSDSLRISIPINSSEGFLGQTTPIVTATGEVFLSAPVADAAGQPARFPDTRGGCYVGGGSSGRFIYLCTDVAAYRFTAAGELVWASYFGGLQVDETKALHVNSDALVLVGTTASADFPSTSGAYLTRYTGKAPTSSDCCSGSDVFAVQMNRANGELIASSYAGLISNYTVKSHAGGDGSVYLVSSSTFGSTALHLDPKLSRALYSATLPANVFATDLHTDGSLLFAGYSNGGVPVTPNAYQKEPAGDLDVFVGRLEPSGAKLQYATYVGTPGRDATFAIKADRDGGVWLNLSSQTSTGTTGSVVHISPDGSKVLGTLPYSVTAIDIDAGGYLHLFGAEARPTPTALVQYPCGAGYVRLSPAGEILFASYIAGAGLFGYTIGGRPVGLRDTEIFQLTEAPSSTPYAGCLRGASLAPGQIVTVYGTGLGPREGAAYRLVNNRVPDEIAGTRVLYYGQPVPLLYVSDTQVNAILPFEIPSNASPVLAVQRGGLLSEVSDLGGGGLPPHIDLLTVDGAANSQALAVNEDGTLNSATNPARLGSVVAFYGIGGGQTDPPSLPGEVVPLNAVRRLLRTPRAWGDLGGGTVEFAGAAPGQVSAVNQINYRLPATLRPNTNANAANIIFESLLLGRGATIAVK